MKTRLRAADDPQAWEKFKEYCIQDVATENAVREKLQAYEQPAAEKEFMKSIKQLMIEE